MMGVWSLADLNEYTDYVRRTQEWEQKQAKNKKKGNEAPVYNDANMDKLLGGGG